MPFKSETYRILIASPSDLTEERQAATDAVNEWNALHAAAESVVLLPVNSSSSATFWCMFWTKIGTRSGVAESGTVEEIDQFVAAGKPALLYFFGRPIDPNKIDLKQHRKLRAFIRSPRTWGVSMGPTSAWLPGGP